MQNWKFHKKNFHSLKNYAADAYKNALRKINNPNNKYFKDVSWAYSDFQKLKTVIDNAVPNKTKRVKGNTIVLMMKYLKNLGQGTHSLKHLRKLGFILIKNYIKSLNMTLKS